MSDEMKNEKGDQENQGDQKDFDSEGVEAEESSDLKSRISLVGSSGKKQIMMAGIIVVAIFFLYNIIFGEDESKNPRKLQRIEDLPNKEERVKRLLEKSKPVTVDERPRVVSIPKKLELPKLQLPEAPPPPPIIEEDTPPPPPLLPISEPELPQQGVLPPPPVGIGAPPGAGNPFQDAFEVSTSGISIIGGGGSGGGQPGGQGGGAGGSVPISGVAGGGNILSPDAVKNFRDSFKEERKIIDEHAPLERSTQAQVKATIVGNLRYMILQGKIINAVLESGIDTDMEGVTRAFVSRDVYAESGKTVLIPAGSRLIGSFSAPGGAAIDRVGVNWDRLILPNGVDIKINSATADGMGRTGMQGKLNSRLGLAIRNSVLTSMIPIVGNALVSKVINNSTSTTTTAPDGTVTSTGNDFANAAREGLNQFSNTLQEALTSRYGDVKPNVLVPPGTPCKIFVGQDLVFPAAVVDG